MARVSVRVRAREYSSPFRCQFECCFVSLSSFFCCCLLACLLLFFLGEKSFDVTYRVLYFCYNGVPCA